MASHSRPKLYWGAITVAVALLVLPLGAKAQEAVPVADAQTFLGQWTVPFETPQGALSMTIHVEDADGDVAARVVSEMGTQAVDTVTKDGDNLVLSYAVDFGGQSAPVALTLQPAGEQLRASMSFADGQFVLDGTATRAAGG